MSKIIIISALLFLSSCSQPKQDIELNIGGLFQQSLNHSNLDIYLESHNHRKEPLIVKEKWIQKYFNIKVDGIESKFIELNDRLLTDSIYLSKSPFIVYSKKPEVIEDTLIFDLNFPTYNSYSENKFVLENKAWKIKKCTVYRY